LLIVYIVELLPYLAKRQKPKKGSKFCGVPNQFTRPTTSNNTANLFSSLVSQKRIYKLHSSQLSVFQFVD